MWITSLQPEDVESTTKLVVAFIGAVISIVTVVGGGIATLKSVWRGTKKKPSEPEDPAADVVQGMPISVEQMEFEDAVRTRKRLERAIALLAKHDIDYEDYIEGKRHHD